MFQDITLVLSTGRSHLRRIGVRAVTAASLFVLLTVTHPAVALAHTDDDAEFGHMVGEFALWTAGLAAVVALLISVLWIRARMLRDEK